jgi:hypothetical protein
LHTREPPLTQFHVAKDVAIRSRSNLDALHYAPPPLRYARENLKDPIGEFSW